MLSKKEMVYSDLVSSISFEDNNGRVETILTLVSDRVRFKSQPQLSTPSSFWAIQLNSDPVYLPVKWV